MDSIILRFRDLITEEEGTINDHKELLKNHGEVWWGWWMKPYEHTPINLFKEIKQIIVDKEYYKAYLFNSGTMKMYRTNIVNIIVAPHSTQISTPQPEKSPSYYHRGAYPAWYLLSMIEEVDINKLDILIKDFPTVFDAKKEGERFQKLINKKIESLELIRDTDVTMWKVEI